MKKTKPKNPSSEPPCDKSPEAAELKMLIIKGRHKQLWKLLKRNCYKKKGLPKDMEDIFFSLSEDVPLQMLIWYVNRYKPEEGADCICKHPQKKPTSPAKAGCGPLSRRCLRNFPKPTRPFVAKKSYGNRPIEPNTRLGHFVIMSYLQSNPTSVSIKFALAVVHRGYKSEIKLLVRYPLPKQVISKLAKKRNSKIAKLAADATVAK